MMLMMTTTIFSTLTKLVEFLDSTVTITTTMEFGTLPIQTTTMTA